MERQQAAKATLVVAGEAQATAAESRDRLSGKERRASERLAQARAALDAAEVVLRAVEERLSRQDAELGLTKLEAVLGQCERAEEARLEALKRAAAVTLTLKDVEGLEALATDEDRARARLEAAGVRVEFAPDGARGVLIGGAPHDPEAPAVLAQDAELRLEGFGVLTIRPGGGVGDVARDLTTATRALTARLRELDQESPVQARRNLDARTEARREGETQERLLSSLAPDGVAELRAAVAHERDVVARALSTEAEALGPVGPVRRDAARRARDAAAVAAQLSEAEERAASTAAAVAKVEAAGRDAKADSASSALAQAEAELAQARATKSDDEVARDLSAAERALSEARQDLRVARSRLEESDLDAARLELGMAERARNGIAADLAQLELGRTALRAELSALGEIGLGEELGRADRDLALARRQLAQSDVEAQAARYLHEALSDAQRESKDQWLGPVRSRVQPYLKLLHPGGDIVLDQDTLELAGLVRDGAQERFDDLSVGAREQVAVIVRLALAELLRTAGKPTAVILDDALVNSDETRLRRMHRVLTKASEQVQVLILTCRERDFVHLGAPITRIR